MCDLENIIAHLVKLKLLDEGNGKKLIAAVQEAVNGIDQTEKYQEKRIQIVNAKAEYDQARADQKPDKSRKLSELLTQAAEQSRQTASVLAIHSPGASEQVSRMYGAADDRVRPLEGTPTDQDLTDYLNLLNDNVDKVNQSVEKASNLAFGNAFGTYANTSEAIKIVGTVAADIESILKAAGLNVPAVAVSPSRRSQLPFPPSHLIQVYGDIEFLRVAEVASGLQDDETNSNAILLLDMQKFLAEEFNAAYDYLNKTPTLWGQCQQAIANAVRGDDDACLETLRNAFLCSVQPPELFKSHTAAMAWMIVVESALLNERLKDDIRQLAASKNAFHLNDTALDGMQFFGPSEMLAPQARQLFNDYVACRWPIHVVAVDPITQDQNVADRFSERREMQLALALGFASGQVSANNFTRMSRRLALDMETIALNRTVVGFSHGDDTFGWRFYPRVQSPDTGGHFQTFAVDMFKGLSRDRILKESRLEPGVREVTAIVIMPCFVPYVIFDTRSSWFKLTDPSKKVMSTRDSMQLSAQISLVRRLSAECIRDAGLYRDGDVHRLTRAVDQIDRRLPMQTTYVQMPFEDTLGGFEFFDTGVPDLAPEIKGFYGEPGIIVDKKPDTKTSIFLVGDHFSVHETKAIAGNRSVDFELLSRQVMRITVPGNAQVVESDNGTFVDVHIATPYGISNHLLVPVAGASDEDAAVAAHEAKRHFDRFKWDPAELLGCFSAIENDGKVKLTLQGATSLKYERQDELPAFGPQQVNVAFWIDLIDSSGAAHRVKKGTVPIKLADFKNGKAALAAVDLAQAVADAMNAESDRRPQAVAQIKLSGFVRCVVGLDGGISDVLPIVATENPIVVKIVPCASIQCCTSPSASKP
ncbi:MAG: hypothetical protein U0992_17145 [Planctomycetaceae bacterium]